MSGPADENTPLLPENSDPKLRKATPLPKFQLGIVLLTLLAEPVSATYIFPFINQLIRELGITGGDDRKIGYYAGLIESLFFVAQALTALHWSRLSDYIGRKPVLLIGLTGLCISNVCFGLSRTFWTLVASRAIAGAFDGNVGIIKSIIGEITDHTNMTQGFAFIPLAFLLGCSIAPLYGGSLANPHERWPGLFSGSFWKQYPYILPCIVTTSFTALALLISALYLKESLPSKQSKGPKPNIVEPGTRTSAVTDQDDSPVPIGILLRSYSVMVPIANHSALALVDIGYFALVPLFYATPIEIGGLGLSPPVIGACLATFGIFDGLFQVLFVAKITGLFGEKRVFRTAVLAFFPLIGLFPVMNLAARPEEGTGPLLWVLIVLQLIFFLMVDMSYSVIYVFTTKATPNKHSLGTINGLSQTATSVARAIGPAAFTSLFAFSKEHNLLEGNLVYVVLAVLACFLVFLSSLLPDLRNEGQENRDATNGLDTA